MINPHKEHSKAIKDLIRNANKGKLLAMYQLYENYSSGKNVEEKNEVIANEYLEKIKATLASKKFRLKSLALYEFRRFRELEIDFDEKITVIIGDNGSGKTSIAEALAKIFSWLNNNFEKDNVNGKPINVPEININADDFSEIIGKFYFDNDNEFEGAPARAVPGYSGNKSSDVNRFKKVGAMYRVAAKDDAIKVPLLAFYSVERSGIKLPQSLTEDASDESSDSRFRVLKDSLDGSSSLEGFSQLYMELVNLSEGGNTKEFETLIREVHLLENSIDEVYEGRTPPDNDPFMAKLIAKKVKLQELAQTSSSKKYKKHVELVNSSIETLVPGVKNLEIDRSSGKPKLLVENFGNKINISQLSQGQKTLVALTGDLARRLVTLNPDAEEPLKAHGIVIIDEIELHLHPRWQQEVLLGLQNAFPNIQFIVTTHSPQVLSTVDNKCIRQLCLDDYSNPRIKVPKFQTKGVASADILARIMETNSIPEKLEEAIWLDKFSEYLNVKNKVEADKIFEKIISHFGKQHPVVLDCESQIRISEMNARLGKSKD